MMEIIAENYDRNYDQRLELSAMIGNDDRDYGQEL